jgi:hypothetical protein
MAYGSFRYEMRQVLKLWFAAVNKKTDYLCQID